MKIEIRNSYSFTQIGRRQNQEDSRCPDKDCINGDQRYFAICDGVGGIENGELASKTVCEALGIELGKYELDKNSFDDTDLSHVLSHVYDALDKVANSQNGNMGTTLALAVIHNSGIMLAHIGDSKVYHLRPGLGIVYRSEDHSLVNEMVKAEIITAEEAFHHPQRHVISRSISPAASGRGRSAATVAHVTDVMDGDLIVLCSDGVTDTVTESELEGILLQESSLRERMSQLARRCVDSDDNNTCVAVEIGSIKGLKGGSQTTITQVSPQEAIPLSFLKKILTRLNLI